MTEPERDSDRTKRDTDDVAFVSVADAALLLGITADAVRARIRRGSLPADKVGGRWRVHLPRQDTDRMKQDTDRAVSGEVVGEFVQHLRDEVQHLREANQDLRDALVRRDHEVSSLQQRVDDLTSRALPAPGGPPGGQGGEDPDRPSLWRRILGRW